MSLTTTPSATREQRTTLAALADELVPEAEGKPAASQVGVHGAWLDRVLTVRPDLAKGLFRILDGAAGKDPRSEIERLNKEAPDDLATLGVVVTGAYYLNPRVRQALGYPGQKPQAPEPGEAEHYLRDGLLEPVRSRGPIYRDAE